MHRVSNVLVSQSYNTLWTGYLTDAWLGLDFQGPCLGAVRVRCLEHIRARDWEYIGLSPNHLSFSNYLPFGSSELVTVLSHQPAPFLLSASSTVSEKDK
jgi:hypothetical protein